MRPSPILTEKYDLLVKDEQQKEEKRIELLNKFISFAFETLGIKNPPEIKLNKDKSFGANNRSFGQFFPRENKLVVSISNRNLADILRTLGHELVHCRQCEEGKIDLENPGESGRDGSEVENEANSQAAVMMREFGRNNPDIYE